LNETVLGEILSNLFPNENIIHNKPLPNYSNIKPDYRIESLKLVFEFDGPNHYTEPSVIIKDRLKDDVYEREGYKLFRFPFFIQCNDMYMRVTGLIEYTNNTTVYSDFPNGFITQSCNKPASFCELGLEVFKRDLDKYGACNEILMSLIMQNSRFSTDWLELLPTSLLYLKEDPTISKNEVILSWMKLYSELFTEVIELTAKINKIDRSSLSEEKKDVKAAYLSKKYHAKKNVYISKFKESVINTRACVQYPIDYNKGYQIFRFNNSNSTLSLYDYTVMIITYTWLISNLRAGDWGNGTWIDAESRITTMSSLNNCISGDAVDIIESCRDQIFN
jgi:hypothetical protein